MRHAVEKLYNSTVGRFSAAAMCTSPVSTPTVAAAPSIRPTTAGNDSFGGTIAAAPNSFASFSLVARSASLPHGSTIDAPRRTSDWPEFDPRGVGPLLVGA